MRRYEGRRTSTGVTVVVINDSSRGDLDPQHAIQRHADHFDFGNPPTLGAAQLALAICMDLLGDAERAMKVYHGFKHLILRHLVEDHWILFEEDMQLAIEAIESVQTAREQRPAGALRF